MATMLALLGIAFGYLDSARQKASYKSALIEGDILFTGLGEALKKNIGKKPKVDTLKGFYSMPISFSAKDGEFDMTFFCEASANKIPISWLGKRSDKKYQKQYEIAKKVFDDITIRAEVKAPDILYNMIVKALLAKGGTRYGISSRVSTKKDIMTAIEFMDILNDYRFKEDDNNVFKIDWQKFFGYEEASAPNNMKIDAQFASPELLAIILDMDSAYIKSDFTAGELDKFMKNAGIEKNSYKWLFAKGAVADMVCTSRFSYAEHLYTILFQYRKGNIKGFKFAKTE